MDRPGVARKARDWAAARVQHERRFPGQAIVKHMSIKAPYVAGMPNFGLYEIVFVFIVPMAVLWIVIYTAVRTAIRHSK